MTTVTDIDQEQLLDLVARATKTYREVYLHEIDYDPRVQRQEGVIEGHVEAIARKFDPLALGALQLSLRSNGRYIVLDGGHRCEVCRRVGYIGPIPAVVFEGLTLKQESDLFDLLNNTRKLSALSHFVARTNALDPNYVEMTRIVKAWGWTITNASTSNGLRAVSAITFLYLRGAGILGDGKHEDLLGRTLGVITSAWGHDKVAASEQIIKGLGKLLAAYPEVSNPRLIAKLQDSTPRQLIAKAKARKELMPGTRTDEALADYVLDQYNRGLTTNAIAHKPWTY